MGGIRGGMSSARGADGDSGLWQDRGRTCSSPLWTGLVHLLEDVEVAQNIVEHALLPMLRLLERVGDMACSAALEKEVCRDQAGDDDQHRVARRRRASTHASTSKADAPHNFGGQLGPGARYLSFVDCCRRLRRARRRVRRRHDRRGDGQCAEQRPSQAMMTRHSR